MKDLDLDQQLGFNIYRVAMLFKREHGRALRGHGLTPEQWQALATLWRREGVSQAELARVTLQDAPTVSRMLARMERNGLVRREDDPADARSSVVRLTKRGSQLRSVLPAKLVQHFGEFLRDFPAAQQRRLLALLRELRDATGDLR